MLCAYVAYSTAYCSQEMKLSCCDAVAVLRPAVGGADSSSAALSWHQWYFWPQHPEVTQAWALMLLCCCCCVQLPACCDWVWQESSCRCAGAATQGDSGCWWAWHQGVPGAGQGAGFLVSVPHTELHVPMIGVTARLVVIDKAGCNEAERVASSTKIWHCNVTLLGRVCAKVFSCHDCHPGLDFDDGNG